MAQLLCIVPIILDFLQCNRGQMEMLYKVIAKKVSYFGDEIVEEKEFDFENPIAVYKEYDLASQHAFIYTFDKGIPTVVIREDDAESLEDAAMARKLSIN